MITFGGHCTDGGFTQAGHGKASGLKRLSVGDWLVFYSSKTSLRGGEPLQAFTAIGRVSDEEPYQVEMAPGFTPWRRNLEFVTSDETPIRPLIDYLSFIKASSDGATCFASVCSSSSAAISM